MKFSCSVLAGILLQFFFLPPVNAQQSTDTALIADSKSTLDQYYFDEIGDNAQIYHGSEYIRNGQKAIGFPFFESDNPMKGSVYYEGVLYPGRNLYYDIVNDEIVTNNFSHTTWMSLSPQKADSFLINEHTFVQLHATKTNGLPRDGYFDQLYSGDPGFYAKREKRLSSGTGSEELKYIELNSYYIRLNNVYYFVSSKSELLDILKDKEDEVKKYIRTNKLNFKKNLESSLVLSTIYYSQLKH
jgi:hypothetical protein